MPEFEIKLRFLTNQRRRRESGERTDVDGFGVEVDLVMITSVEPESDIESQTELVAESVEEHLENHNFDDDETAGR